MSFEFGNNFDPFSNETVGKVTDVQPVHIRVQQRNGRKTLTTIQGLDEELDKKKILKVLKKNFNCNGNVTSHKEYGEVIQLQGDHREKASKILTQCGLVDANNIKIHGF